MDALSRLAVAARDGDDRALDRFVEAAYAQVWRLCVTLVDRQSAEDLAQEVVMRAVRALPAYRGEATARTWLLGIGRRVCMDELRALHRRRRRDRALAEMCPDPEGRAGHEIEVTDLLRGLEPDRRAAFVLTQTFGLSYEEAARVCQCPVGTIRSRVARARADLIELLDSGDSAGELDRPQAGHSTFG